MVIGAESGVGSREVLATQRQEAEAEVKRSRDWSALSMQKELCNRLRFLEITLVFGRYCMCLVFPESGDDISMAA